MTNIKSSMENPFVTGIHGYTVREKIKRGKIYYEFGCGAMLVSQEDLKIFIKRFSKCETESDMRELRDIYNWNDVGNIKPLIINTFEERMVKEITIVIKIVESIRTHIGLLNLDLQLIKDAKNILKYSPSRKKKALSLQNGKK